MKKTVVIGASTNPERYSYKAIEALVNHGIDTFALGLRKGTVAGINILLKPENDIHCDTVTLYVGPVHQPQWEETILALSPRRVIFNPGTENPSFEQILKNEGMDVERACTLVLLATNQY
jgi:predicted CoA-binding protein